MVTKLHARLQTNGSVFIPGQDFEREVDADGGLWARGRRGGGGMDEEHGGGSSGGYAGSGGCNGDVMDAAVAMIRVALMMPIMIIHLVRG